ncbi:transposase [Streptomyces rubiginosohelvolus]|uniref:transposase n=1 Tax=Streptomyces rubiginosohelvolus TaxID=67362 RepID=UPI003F4DA064
MSLTDAQWARIEPLLPDRTPKRGGRWRDHRQVIEYRTGTPWMDLPEHFGRTRCCPCPAGCLPGRRTVHRGQVVDPDTRTPRRRSGHRAAGWVRRCYVDWRSLPCAWG